MGRGFLWGGFWGLAVSAAAVVLVSQGARRDIGVQVAPDVVVQPTGEAPAAPDDGGEPLTPPPDPAPEIESPDAPLAEDNDPAAPRMPSPTPESVATPVPVIVPPASEDAPPLADESVPPVVADAPDALGTADDAGDTPADPPETRTDPETAAAPDAAIAPPAAEDSPPVPVDNTLPAVADAPDGPVVVQAIETPSPRRPSGEQAAPTRVEGPALVAPDMAAPLPVVAGPPTALPPGPGPTVASLAPTVPAPSDAATGPVRPADDTAPARVRAPGAPDGPGPVSPAQTDAAPIPETTEAPEPAPEIAAVRTAPPVAVVPPALGTEAPDTPVSPAPAGPEPEAQPEVSGLPTPASPETTPQEPSAGAPPLPVPQPAPPEARADAEAMPSPDAPAGAAPPAEDAGETPEVVTDRLPRIGDPAEPVVPEIAPDTAPEVLAADALTRNGAPFDNPDGRPIVAVVLLDEPDAPPVKLPITVSVAIAATTEGAAARAAAYRAAGVEVVLIPGLPQGARASDVVVTLEDVFTRIPDAVALMDTPEGAMQGNREALGQVVSVLGDTGHGLITFPKGLNTAQQVAERGDVTAGLVFRQIDDEGQDLRAVKRFLDQAAFRARQENAVILVGRNRPETLAALAEWALGNRAASVALAPVSAALKALAP